jgi:hypothetical protein
VYVAGIFAGFMAMAHFVFHSPDAVKGLLMTGVGSVASLFASTLIRVEYRLTDEGVSKRQGSGEGERAFKLLFRWEELSHLVATRTGFRYRTQDRRSGELHVEAAELAELRALLGARDVPILGPGQSAQVKRGG